MIDNEELRKQAEEKAKRQHAWLDRNEPETLPPMAIRSLFEELHIHQVELEMQNEELRKTQEELEISRKRYFELFDLAPVGYLTIPENGLIVEANLTAATLLGLPRTTLKNKPLSQFIKKEDNDLWYLTRKRILETGTRQQCELRLVRNGGTPFWAQLTGDSAPAGRGNREINLVFKDITERKASSDKIAALLSEKELILKEVHHRVKNNMTSISSLLSMRASTLSDPVASAALEDAGRRVMSMMTLYDKLYQSEEYGKLSVARFLPGLVAEIVTSFDTNGRIGMEQAVDDFELPAEKLQPLGIIINELVSNCMKYAFKGRSEGKVTISASTTGSNVRIAVGDDGVGIPESVDFAYPAGFGLILVDGLVQQLGGTVRIERKNGTMIIVEFEK